MARSTITPTSLGVSYNLTDSADFTTLSTGSGNGVTFAWDADDLVVLKNTTGGPATFTFIVQHVPANYTTWSITPSDPTVVVADGKTVVLRLPAIFKNDSDGLASIDCDVAADILVLDL